LYVFLFVCMCLIVYLFCCTLNCLRLQQLALLGHFALSWVDHNVDSVIDQCCSWRIALCSICVLYCAVVLYVNFMCLGFVYFCVLFYREMCDVVLIHIPVFSNCYLLLYSTLLILAVLKSFPLTPTFVLFSPTHFLINFCNRSIWEYVFGLVFRILCYIVVCVL